MSNAKRSPKSVPQQALVALVAAADRLKREVSQVIEAHGITMQQYNVLRILRGAGSAGLPTLEIGARMIEQAPGVTRLLARLVRKQLVSRAACPEDGRRVICRISHRGLTLLSRMDTPVLEADCAAVSTLSHTDQLRLLGLLAKLHRES
ncbi:MAG: MarR family transcriptional regulator [Gemmatimonadota bacterium]